MPRLSVLLLLLLLAASCRPQRNTLPNNYLSALGDTTGLLKEPLPETVIQPGDLLSIQIFSASLNPQVDAPFNQVNASGSAGPTAGYLVDAAGQIEFPRLGKLQAAGLTKNGLADRIKERLEGQLTAPSVLIRFLNYRITVLGEVNSPGSFVVPVENVTLLQALGLAGDVSQYGLKSSVKILREVDGRREVGVVDLTSPELFASPFYQLKQNDVIIVEQTRQALRQRDQQTLALQIGLATSVLTGVALLLNLIR